MKKQILILLLVFLGSFSLSQAQTITGTVTGADDGMPIPGATISVKGTSVMSNLN